MSTASAGRPSTVVSVASLTTRSGWARKDSSTPSGEWSVGMAVPGGSEQTVPQPGPTTQTVSPALGSSAETTTFWSGVPGHVNEPIPNGTW